jgi:hypothetical protein
MIDQLVYPHNVKNKVNEIVDEVNIVKQVDTIADLQGLTGIAGQQVSVASYHGLSDLSGGGTFVWGTGRHNGGTFIDPNRAFPSDWNDQAQLAAWLVDSGIDVVGFKRVINGDYYVEMFGALPSFNDNTLSYDALIKVIPQYYTVKFGSPQEYSGHFISETKSLHVDLQGATLINTVDDKRIMQIGSFDVDEYAVIEAELYYLDIQFTVTGASSFFNVGDIGYLWDQAVRPTGGDVNFEVVKIKDITGDVITVVGFLASYKGAASIKFYHNADQLKYASVRNGKVKPTNTHNQICFGVFNCDGVIAENIKSIGTTGDALAIRYCYNVSVNDIRPVSPVAVGSGQGYGVALFAVSHYSIKNVKGIGCRHVYDQDSVYFGDIEDIEDMDDKAAPFVLAHNGFAGYITFKKGVCKSAQYPVSFSDHGYGGAVNAERGKHPFRKITINDVKSTVPSTKTVNEFNVAGVYFSNSVEDVIIDGIDVNYLNADAVTSASSSILVRVDGIARGYFSINNLHANKIGRVFFSTGNKGTLVYNGTITKIRNVKIDSDVREVVLAQGPWNIDIDVVHVNNVLTENVMNLQAGFSSNPVGCYVGNNVNYLPGPTLLASTHNIKGRLPLQYKEISGITVTEGSAITSAQLQSRTAKLRLVSPVATGSMSMSNTLALPLPLVDHAELYLMQQDTARQNVIFPAGASITTGFTINGGETLKLISEAGKWIVIARMSAI